MGSVVDQRMHWGGQRIVEIGGGGPDAIPTPSGGSLVRATFPSPSRVALEAIEPSASSGALGPGERWHWANGHGVEVDLDLVPLVPARRGGGQPGGDVALLVMVLMLAVGVAQAQIVLDWIFPSGQNGIESVEHEPTPELLARLLKRDLDGAEQGMAEMADRPEHERGAKSFYMPSGQEDGSLEQNGGGAQSGDRVVRGDAPEDELDDPAPEAVIAQLETQDELDGTIPDLELPDAPPAPEALLLASSESPQSPQERFDAADPIERFIGWGFRDWLDVADARPEVSRDWARKLSVARHRLAIDPNDPAALNVVGYYAYLAENSDLARETYARYTKLYPADPAGLNNLALTFKRTGDYPQEEALYRQALDIDPLDPHVLNNLAVNLAHQGRHDEALRVMDLLDELDPKDPYAALHRSKIYATMGKREKAYRHLKRALEGVADLDTMHHIEFRQDIRIDPAFDGLRADARFGKLLHRFYGDEANYLVKGPTQRGRRDG
jgi:hypothetical protein